MIDWENEYCCACFSDEDCGCPHTCDLTAEEIAANKARSAELAEIYASLKPGEKKYAPPLGKWVTLVVGTHANGQRYHSFETCDPPE